MPTTLVPGLLVSLKTSITGNVRYFHSDKQPDRVEGSKAKASWKTERVIDDIVEYEAASKARGLARTAIGKVCITSAFGLLCPEDKAGALDGAIAEARRIADEFNDSAKVSSLRVYVITGRIASNDEEAIKAINSEVRDLIDQMADGVEKKDIKAIREAAGRAKQLGNMLSAEAAAKVQIAVDASRDFASAAVKADKDGQTVQVDKAAVTRIRGASALFMDDEAPAAGSPSSRPKAATLDLGA